MWNIGIATSATSSGRKSLTAADCARLATRLRWVSITPLGRPVVPDEYGSVAVAGEVELLLVERLAEQFLERRAADDGHGPAAGSRSRGCAASG